MEATQALISWKPVSECIITACLQSRHAKTTMVQVYVPTEDADDADKATFYEQLQDIFDRLPGHEIKLLIGNL